MNSTPQAPRVLKTPLNKLTIPGLPEATHPGFADALIEHCTSIYAARGWSAIATVSDGFMNIVAVPEKDVDPKEYLLAFLRNGEIDYALKGLEALNEMFDAPDIAVSYGVALSEAGLVEESLIPLHKCLSLYPTDLNASVALGLSYARLKRYTEAEAVLKTASKVQPDNPAIKLSLAESLAMAGKFQEALPVFRQAASLAPSNAAALMGLAQCLDSVNEHRDEALKVYAQVAKRFPGTVFGDSARLLLDAAPKPDLGN